MTAIFLLIWFYLYAGILFVQPVKAIGLFASTKSFWLVIGWPVYLVIYLLGRRKTINGTWSQKN